MNDQFEEFERALSNSVDDVFFDGVKKAAFERGAPPLPGTNDMVIAAVSFVSEHVCGGVTALAARETVKALHPMALDDVPSESADCDVLGEFTNMLVGHMKNGFLHRGLVLMIGIPIAAVARHVRLNESDGSSAWYSFPLSSGCLYVRLDATIAPEFALLPEPAEDLMTDKMMFF